VTRSRLVTAALVVVAWAYVLTRSVPTQIGDRGIFVSVAERIAAGDRLYVDVWDNKDPLFYLTLGLGRLLTPYADVVIELSWLAAASVAAYAIARQVGVSRDASALVGLAATPLVLTGTEYLAGFTHLPASALCLAVLAGTLRGRYAVAGVLVAVLALFKLVMLPLAVVAIVVVLYRRRTWAPLKALLLGLLAALLVLGALLLVRGELVAYLQSLLLNVEYSQSMQDQSSALPIVGLLGKVMTTAAMATALATVAVLAGTRLASDEGGERSTATDGLSDDGRTLWWVTLWSLIAAMAIVAVTGLWPHHSQILYLPAVLAIILLASATTARHALRPAVVVLLAATTLVLAGAPSPQLVTDSVLSTPTRLRALDDLSPATVDLLATGPAGSYARVGLNDELGHAYGLRDWTLACPKFHQYEYDPLRTYQSVEDCIPTAPWLIVGSSLAPKDGYPQWNAYVAAVEAIIAKDFTCQSRDWGRLCRNTGG
jgi:hypothetical protein